MRFTLRGRKGTGSFIQRGVCRTVLPLLHSLAGESLRTGGEARPTGRPSLCEEAKGRGCAPPDVLGRNQETPPGRDHGLPFPARTGDGGGLIGDESDHGSPLGFG